MCSCITMHYGWNDHANVRRGHASGRRHSEWAHNCSSNPPGSQGSRTTMRPAPWRRKDEECARCRLADSYG
jgi:hypothetical protein